MPNVRVGDQEADLLIADEGLVLVPCPKQTDQGKERVLTMVQGVPLPDLVGAPGARWIPYEEIATADVSRKIPFRGTLRLHDGSTFELKERLGSDVVGESHQVLADILDRFR